MADQNYAPLVKTPNPNDGLQVMTHTAHHHVHTPHGCPMNRDTTHGRHGAIHHSMTTRALYDLQTSNSHTIWRIEQALQKCKTLVDTINNSRNFDQTKVIGNFIGRVYI